MTDFVIDLIEEIREYLNIDFNSLQERILNGELEVILREYDISKGGVLK